MFTNLSIPLITGGFPGYLLYRFLSQRGYLSLDGSEGDKRIFVLGFSLFPSLIGLSLSFGFAHWFNEPQLADFNNPVTLLLTFVISTLASALLYKPLAYLLRKLSRKAILLDKGSENPTFTTKDVLVRAYRDCLDENPEHEPEIYGVIFNFNHEFIASGYIQGISSVKEHREIAFSNQSQASMTFEEALERFNQNPTRDKIVTSYSDQTITFLLV
ncbi:hypothetical protein R4Y45_06280 [Holzapfeliella sp. He02]|uniref:Uncharacterized protein n=1 Tax=Holzapfeliella saturejae TaxID=3082953 RepID=A0ABU8SHH3_9LACO